MNFAVPLSVRLCMNKLTDSEMEVLEELCSTSYQRDEIAKRIGISPGTVHAHTISIYRKFRLVVGDQRVQLAALILLPAEHPWRMTIMKRNGWF